MNIRMDMIEAGTRLRGVSADTVATLAASIATVGLINPITVYERGIIRAKLSVRGWGIVAGLHRLEACRSLGMDEIPAHVVTLGEIERQIAECDENLCGTKLTPSERAMFTARRKQAYEALHPETRNGTNQHTRVGKLCQPNFTEDTAAKTNQAERTVRLDVTRGERIDEAVLSDIRGTPLDKGVHLDAIASVPKEEQRAAIRRMCQTQSTKAPRLTKAQRLALAEQIYQVEAHYLKTQPPSETQLQAELVTLIVETLGEARNQVLGLIVQLPPWNCNITSQLKAALAKQVAS